MSDAAGRTGERVPATVVLLALAGSVVLLLFGLDRGVDFTDEAYYLAWINDPTRFEASIHPFGLPLHLAYGALGRSVVLLRLSGLLLLLATGALLGQALGRYYQDRLSEGFRRRLPSFGALAGLAYYAFWIMTPNYNLLANASGAMILAGALGWAIDDDRSEGRSRMPDGAWSALVGLSGCLAFFAKPTFAALCALAIALVLGWGAWRNPRRAVIRAAIVGLACLVPLAVVVQASVGLEAFLASIRIGTAVLASDNSLTHLPVKTAGEFYRGSPLFAINLFALLVAWAWSHDRRATGQSAPTLTRMITGVVALDLVFLGWNVVNGLHIQARPWVQLGLAGVCLALGMIALGLTREDRGNTDTGRLWPVLVLVAMPFAVAFGTLNSLLVQTGQSLFAILLALAVGGRLLFRPVGARRVEIAAALAVPAILLWSSAYPYDLPRSLYAQTQPVALPFTTSTLRVDAETKRYVEDLRLIADRGALGACTPIFDLSGGGPGTALVLNNRAPYFPWLFHLFGATGRIVDAAWDSMSPTRQQAAWVVGPVHPSFRDTRIARDLAARQGGYRLAGTSAMVFWGRIQRIGLWRPVAPPAVPGCASRLLGQR